MSKYIQEKIAEMKEKPKKIRFIFKTLIWKGIPKKVLFLIWIILLIYYPIWNPIYLDESSWIHLEYLTRVYIDMIFSGLQLTLLFFSIFHSLFEKFINNSITLFVFLLISVACAYLSYFYISYSILIIPLFGIGAYIIQRLIVIGNSAPLIEKWSRPLHLEKRHLKPFWFMLIESLIVIILITYLKIRVIPEGIFVETSASFTYWIWSTISFSLISFLIYMLIRKRNTPYYHHIKSLFFYILPILQIYNLYLVLQDLIKNVVPLELNLPYYIDLFIFLGLAIWDLLNEIGDEIDLGQEIDTKKLYSLILWSYSITAFMQFNEQLESDGFTLADFSEMASLIFVGFGIFYLVKKLGKSLAGQYQIKDFTLNKFLFKGNF